MTCPYCHTEYTPERPCFCHPAREVNDFDRPREEPLWMARGELPMALGIDVIPAPRQR